MGYINEGGIQILVVKLLMRREESGDVYYADREFKLGNMSL